MNPQPGVLWADVALFIMVMVLVVIVLGLVATIAVVLDKNKERDQQLLALRRAVMPERIDVRAGMSQEEADRHLGVTPERRAMFESVR